MPDDVEFIGAEEMEERLNEALDLIDDLTKELDEKDEELTITKDTLKELEEKVESKDKVGSSSLSVTHFCRNSPR